MVLGTSLFFTRFYIVPAFLLQLFEVCYLHIPIILKMTVDVNLTCQLNHANWATSFQPHREIVLKKMSSFIPNLDNVRI